MAGTDRTEEGMVSQERGDADAENLGVEMRCMRIYRTLRLEITECSFTCEMTNSVFLRAAWEHIV